MQDEMEKLARWHEETARAWSGCTCEECCAFASYHTDAAATIRAAMALLSDAGNIIGDTAVFCSNAGGWFENDPMPIASELGGRCNDFSAALEKGATHE